MSLQNVVRIFASVTFIALLFPAMAQAQIYRWVDDKGQVHFSDKPVDKAKAEVVNIETSPSSWQPLDIEVIRQGNFAADAAQLGTARIQRDVNNVYRFYDQVMYFDFYRKVPVKIHLLADQDQYMRFVRDVMKNDGSMSKGVFIPALNEIAVFIHPPELGGIESTYATIRHEASHAILFSLASLMPVWLNEGMAEQMETLTDDGGQLQIAMHAENKAVCQHYQTQLPDALEYTRIRGDIWQQTNRQTGMNQAMAGQMVYQLLAKNYGRSLITRLLQDYHRGVNRRVYYLLDEHYIGGKEAFRIHWQQWLNSGMNQPAAIRF